MSAVDITPLREGDTVLVRMTVDHITPNGCLVGYGWDEHGIRAHPADVVSVEPSPLAVGDKVRVRQGDDEFEIRAIIGEHAWIRLWGGTSSGVGLDLRELVRA